MSRPPKTWPRVIYSEEVIREGFGIEDVAIPLDDRVALLDALSETGLRRISVGAFSSARYVPQMACFAELLGRFHPKPGVAYLPFVHTAKARKFAEQYAPPLTLEDEMCTLFLDICDVHGRRNTNRSIEQVLHTWPDEIAEARQRGITRGRIAIASAWGSNFLGKFSQEYRLGFLEQQAAMLGAGGIELFEIGLHDSQSWCLPHEVEADVAEVKRRWPEVRHFHLHMHDARGMALPAICAALRVLDHNDTVIIDGTLGGIGGGQYSGNGRAAGMAATEDVLHMLEGMGIETGVDLDRIIECVWMLERIIGRPTNGHVSKAGPRPRTAMELYDPNMPGIESFEAVKHFKFGAQAYQGQGYVPWRTPIAGPYHATASSHDA